MKQDRIELRASQQDRERLIEAASFVGMNLSAFLRYAALEKSEEILHSRDILTLSNRDRDMFLDALENPPKTNKRLQEAFKTYHKKKNAARAPIAPVIKSSARKVKKIKTVESSGR